MSDVDGRCRMRVRVEGTVQGVGFRPYVHRLARELGLGGWVLNDERGVLLEAEGRAAAVEELISRLPAEAPPLAVVDRVSQEEVGVGGSDGLDFEIRESAGGNEPDALVSPDTAPCDDCIAEMLDPADRRHRYPFINCTNCGPRFTIVRGVPYDRPLTTMAGFEMCASCSAEYGDPGDRRFHAQPNACPACGPRARLCRPDGTEVELGPDADAVSAAAGELRAGRILAIKGVGGYHLACLASDEGAVAALRLRKHRFDKPLALMAADLAAAQELVGLDNREAEIISSRERPIVVARRRSDANVAPSVAPATPDLGVMLPYAPLHHLLLADVGAPLVLTSGNISDEPIAFADADAIARLSSVADAFLIHDRPIETRTDDSVLRSTGRREPLLIRRSRGYVPAALELPLSAPPLLGCGAELKNTFCLAKGTRAWVGPHIGDLENFETLESFREGVAHFERLFAVAPEVVAHDMHPEYLSTKFAEELHGVELVAVQHHHAHMAACLAEHGQTGPAVGAIFDGTGFGTDGTVWGGEILVGDLGSFDRAAMLHPALLPGGSAAIQEPWRMSCSWLVTATGDKHPAIPAALSVRVDPARWHEVCELVRTGVASPGTTSMGRLFDAAAAICGIGASVSYEGQAAAEFEAIADLHERGTWPVPLLAAGDGIDVIDPRELVRSVAKAAGEGVALETISARFHNSVAAAAAAGLITVAESRGIGMVVVSGGVFQNRLLLERTLEALAQSRLRVLIPLHLPPNDGGISYGQAAVAAARFST